MGMDQVQVVMAKRKPNWSESELFALSDAVDLTFQSSAVNLAQPGLTARDKKLRVGPKLLKGKSFPREIKHDLHIIYPPSYPLF